MLGFNLHPEKCLTFQLVLCHEKHTVNLQYLYFLIKLAYKIDVKLTNSGLKVENSCYTVISVTRLILLYVCFLFYSELRLIHR